MTPTDTLFDAPLEPLPPEAGDVNAPRFEPSDDWLKRTGPTMQKVAMWRWFATRYEDPKDPETTAPHEGDSRHLVDGEGPIRVDEVLHRRFDGCVPRPVVDELVERVQRAAGKEWARRGVDEFGG
jgi:hypothetical protein